MSFVPCNVLFLACHPDDIEIGAAGTAARLAAAGWNVWICILTSEKKPDVREDRHTEALAGAAVLGVPNNRVIFAGFPDGDLTCNAETVGSLRTQLKEHECEPDLVFTHTKADSHNDHRAANEITLSTFRKKPILCYAVVNSLISSEFKPKIFIETSQYNEQRLQALKEHQTQANRIDYSSIERLLRSYSENLGLEQTEAFELYMQEGSEDLLYLVQSINDCPFHNFWFPLIYDQSLTIIHSTPVRRRQSQWTSTADNERDGIQRLFQTFTQLWHDKNPLEILRADTPTAEKILETSTVLLSGSAVSNALTRHYINHFAGLRYIVEYTMPDYQNIHIKDQKNNTILKAQYEDDGFGNQIVAQDYGILTVMVNPMRPTRYIIGCMGIHAKGTLACFETLINREHLRELTNIMSLPPRGNTLGYQVLVEYHAKKETTSFVDDSLHAILNHPLAVLLYAWAASLYQLLLYESIITI